MQLFHTLETILKLYIDKFITKTKYSAVYTELCFFRPQATSPPPSPPTSAPAPPPRPPVDLTRLKPLWLLLDSMNSRLSADCSPQSLTAAHRALMELFLMVEGMVREWDMEDEYVLAMYSDDAIKRSLVQVHSSCDDNNDDD